ncbi:MAG: helix-hairpin-helix domain-containing protein, partial [Peptococcia bacterium]
QYYVPKKGEEQIIPISNESSVGEKVRAKVNINRASLSELQTLNGIGPALAQRIIDYRREQGPFNSIEEITEVKGIGSVLLEKIRDNITV